MNNTDSLQFGGAVDQYLPGSLVKYNFIKQHCLFQPSFEMQICLDAVQKLVSFTIQIYETMSLTGRFRA